MRFKNRELKVIDIRTAYDSKNQPRDIIQTTMKPSRARPCKNCRQEPREPFSSRCKKCNTMKMERKISDAKLMKKLNG